MPSSPATAFTAADHAFMSRALKLARLGETSAHPNPRVGCVLVNDGEVVGEGWHRQAGEPHAEVNALAAAGDRARGATAYVTLEPCAHHGKTPPCADSLIAAGIAAVVSALDDPNEKVAGRGLQRLRDAGIRVRCGLLEAEAASVNAGFLSRMQRGRPYLRLKMAASLDGRTAMASGESQWITGPAARDDVQRFRSVSGAVLTGIGTVLADDPSLTVRPGQGLEAKRQPLRVVLDARAQTPATARMLGLPGQTAIFCGPDAESGPLRDAGAAVYPVQAVAGRLVLPAVLSTLGQLEINDVFVEAGPLLAGSLLDAGLVDELVIYQAPHIMGSETRGMFATPGWLALEQRLALSLIDVRRVGADIRMVLQPANSEMTTR